MERGCDEFMTILCFSSVFLVFFGFWDGARG